MSSSTTRKYLMELHQIILEERACAKALDMEGMTDAMSRKEAMILLLADIALINKDDQSIAARIRRENRRNAYLFKSTLGWIRDTMDFLEQKSVASTYSPTAYTVNSQINGRLLSGKI